MAITRSSRCSCCSISPIRCRSSVAATAGSCVPRPSPGSRRTRTSRCAPRVCCRHRREPRSAPTSRSTSASRWAAGLGGGSSDAATVLLGLNRLWSLGLPRDRLAALGLELGADVPFFLGGRAALARGIGEVLTPLHRAARVDRARHASRARADGGDLRLARIDTKHPVGENERLFRRLWSKRSSAHRRCELPPDRGGAAGPPRILAGGADDRIGGLRFRRVALAFRCAGGRRRGDRGTAGLEGRGRPTRVEAPARGIRMMAGRVVRRTAGTVFRWGVAKW